MTSTEQEIAGSGFALPRVLPGFGMSSRAWNTVDEARVALSASYRVWTSIANEVPPNAGPAPANVDLLVPWTPPAGHGLPRSVWSAAFSPVVTVPFDGSWLVVFQMRWAALGPYGLNGSSVGSRLCRIMLNGNSAQANTIATSPPRAGSTLGDGVTTQALALRPFRAGDQLWAGFRHSASGPVTCSNTDAGGTFMSITYLGPGARQ